ncbi:hypothetical protein SAMN00017405_0448 [Desulfonispora thiosulfatigenes DSM 11270]|uniref:Uncharacterized protein n=1 Tax=Desulfonispora thiosulfatigenes DSM 11270 TaxID=656914 RepID=A0A1W1VQX1_DESTI|nr:hypothetical protein [Desulfonispora thiosulfatigenes]SMB95620.1 hypothetical protein SAMN00017405_0448 [Desulfonispora thiosulfatigenes DSM 11270]
MVNCPICTGKSIGKLANNQYFCWECYIEFNNTGNQTQVFDIAEDGSLVSLNNDQEVLNYTDATLT